MCIFCLEPRETDKNVLKLTKNLVLKFHFLLLGALKVTTCGILSGETFQPIKMRLKTRLPNSISLSMMNLILTLNLTVNFRDHVMVIVIHWYPQIT